MTDSIARLRNKWAIPILIFVIALVPRVYVALNDCSLPISDEHTYDKYAWSFAQNAGRVEKGKFIHHPLGSFTYRPPGYPLFLGLIYKALGHSYRAARVIQAVLGASSCSLFYLIGRKLFSKAVGALSALIVAGYSLMVRIPSLLLSETLFIFLLSLFALCALSALEGGGKAMVFLAGAFLGLATITRPVVLPLIPSIFAWFILPGRFRRERLSNAVLLLLSLLLTIGPIVVKNYQIHGELIPISTHDGITFWRGVLKGDADYPSELTSLRDRIGDLPELVQRRLYYRAAIDYLRCHPGEISGILRNKLKLLFVYTSYKIAHKRVIVAEDPCLWYFLLSFGVLGGLLRPGEHLLERALMYAIVCSQVVVLLVYDVNVRHRIPLIPFFALFAAYASVTLFNAISEEVKGREKGERKGRWDWGLCFALLLAGAFYYIHGNVRWLAYDDEGGYLYAAWRITQGEMPYRDFLTPKLPLFLYPGALLLRLSGNSVFALRTASALAVLTAAFLLYLTVEKVFGAKVALLAMAVFMVHCDVFWSARFFRPEAYMLLWSMAGIYLFVRSYPGGQRLGLAVSGLLFALGTLARFFGALPFAGCALFVAYDALRGGEAKRAARKAVWFLAPYTALVGFLLALFALLTPSFFSAVLGHHLRQGSELTRLQVFIKGLKLYRDYFLSHPFLLALTVPAIVLSLRTKDKLSALFSLQLPTALICLFLSRSLAGRHLVHLVPSISALFASSLVSFADRGTKLFPRPLGRWLGAICILCIAALSMWPSLRENRWVASWREDDTALVADYIRTHTDEGDYVLSDYPGLNFYARRRNTFSGAGLSRGAALGGQITGADLVREIEENDVKMVLVNIAQGAHQMVNLRDYERFHRYVQGHFHLAGRLVYDYRLMEVYHRDDLMPSSPKVNFGDKIALTGLAWGDRPLDLIDQSRAMDRKRVEAGGEFELTIRWKALAKMDEDYYLVLTLVDEKGHLWGLGQKQLVDIGAETYWDEKGLERAVRFPTSQWPVGEVVLDRYELPVSPGTPPGRYQVRARIRPLSTWEGLEVLDTSHRSMGLECPLGIVEVSKPAKPPSLAELKIPYPLKEDLGGKVRLLGYDLSAEKLRPGDPLHLSLFWKALCKMRKDYDLLLQIRDDKGRVWAEGRFPLVSEGYPSSQWAKGEVLKGQYDLFVRAEAPACESWLFLNLIDVASGDELLNEDISLSKLRIAGRRREFTLPEAVQHPMRADLGHRVAFLGYDLAEEEVMPGEVLHLTIYWQAQRRMGISYKVFTHLLGADGRVWGQKDNVPVCDTYPTTGWLPGEVVVDEYEILVKPSAPAGKYLIEVGMYNEATGERLPAFDEEGNRLPESRILLDSEVRVKR